MTLRESVLSDGQPSNQHTEHLRLLLQLWRESSRHIELGDVLERITPLVARELPVDLVIVRHVDLERGTVETVAMHAEGGEPAPFPASSECRPDGLRRVLEWCRGGDLWRSHSSQSGFPIASLLLPTGLEGRWVAGPLDARNGPPGVLLLRIRTGRRLEADHEALVRALLDPIAAALATHARFHELARLREALEADKRALLARLDRQEVSEAIVGSETGLREAMERVQQVAATDAPVLILGDTGTGKEVLARTIHTRSHRARAPIVRVNCGALPPGLVDSELFGHERGSFTGAVNTRQGWFERADGGTLFLDEIGELPLEAQVRLLRVLQDGTFERVGGHKVLRVDVRVVAATNRDLRDMVRLGTFREDLWYRISVFPIRLPSLRERPEDIPALATHFAARAGKRLGGGPLPVSSEDVRLLLAYDWPGNVRELAAVIERAAILGDGRQLRVASALGHAAVSTTHGAEAARSAGDSVPVRTLDAVVTEHIERTLRQARGRVEGPAGAARHLGVNPHTLRARMRKLKIDWSRFRVSGSGPEAP